MPATPYTAFNFVVELTLDGEHSPVCSAGFSECDGLEMNMEPKSYRQGGDNAREIHLVGPVSYGQLTLKRGMTDSFDLWNWFQRVMDGEYELRASGTVVMMSSDRQSERARFKLSRCIPIKIKAPALNAAEGGVAVEEMQLAYERLQFDKPGSTGFGISASASVSASASLSIG